MALGLVIGLWVAAAKPTVAVEQIGGEVYATAPIAALRKQADALIACAGPAERPELDRPLWFVWLSAQGKVSRVRSAPAKAEAEERCVAELVRAVPGWPAAPVVLRIDPTPARPDTAHAAVVDWTTAVELWTARVRGDVASCLRDAGPAAGVAVVGLSTMHGATQRLAMSWTVPPVDAEIVDVCLRRSIEPAANLSVLEGLRQAQERWAAFAGGAHIEPEQRAVRLRLERGVEWTLDLPPSDAALSAGPAAASP